MTDFMFKVTKFILQIFKADSFNWTLQELPAAGQTIPHLHMHIIPRHLGDLPHPGDWYPKLIDSEAIHIDSESRGKLPVEQMLTITQHLRDSALRFSMDE